MASLEGTKTDRQPLTGDISVKHGLDGESVTITDITESTEDGGTNTVKFSDGSMLNIKNGSSGKNGKDGKTAYQYAQDGGYTGTEEEFAVLMAQENLQTEKVSKLSEDIATKASAIKETASGETIVVTDSDEAKPLGLVIDGKSEQTQYSGKNLIPYPYPKTTDSSEGIVFTILDNGAIKYKGTSTGYATFAFCNDWKPNKGTYKKNVGEKCNLTVARYLRSSDSYYSAIANNETTQFSTTDWDFETYKYKIFLQVIPSHGAVDNVFYPMICLSTETDMDTYEPYVGGKPSPSTEYEQKIRNIGKYDEASGKYAVEVKTVGENLAKLLDKEFTSNGITWKCKDGVVTASGTAQYISATRNTGLAYKIPLGTKGTFYVSGGNDNAVGVYVLIRKIDNSVEYPINRAFVLDGTETEVELYLQVKSGLTVNETVYPMLNIGNTALPFKPHKETTSTVYLDEPLRKEDKAYWNGGSKVRVDRKRKRIKVLPTMGFLVWTTQNAKYNRYMLAVDDVADGSGIAYPVMSDYFASTTKGDAFSEKVSCGVFVDATSSSSGIRYIGFVDSTHSTIDDFKQFLTDNDVFVEYDLATPITEEIDIDFDGLSMFYPTTILSNDCNANMEVEYIADTKAYIDKKFAELATAMV